MRIIRIVRRIEDILLGTFNRAMLLHYLLRSEDVELRKQHTALFIFIIVNNLKYTLIARLERKIFVTLKIRGYVRKTPFRITVTKKIFEAETEKIRRYHYIHVLVLIYRCL